MADEGAGRRGFGGGGGDHADDRGTVAGHGRGDRGDAGLGLQGGGQPGERGRSGRGGGGAGQLQGAVEAGVEPVGEQLVGVAGGGAGRVVARIGGAEPQRQHRDGQHDHRDRGGGGQDRKS